MVNFLCDQVKYFNSVDDFEWENGAVRNHDRGIVFTRLGGRKRLHIGPPATIAFAPIRSAILRWFPRNVGTVLGWSPRRCSFCLASKSDQPTCHGCSTEFQKFSSRNFFGHNSLPLMSFRSTAAVLAALLSHLCWN